MNIKCSAAKQLEVADNLTELWRGLFPDHDLPSRTQFLTWAGMASEGTAAFAINRAARKIRKEPMTTDRLGRYISGVMLNEREGRHVFGNRSTATPVTSYQDSPNKRTGELMTNNSQTPIEGELTSQELEQYDANNPSPTRLLAEEILNSGEIADNCTLADAKAALERRFPPQ